jgi:signal transduction histidine kinase
MADMHAVTIRIHLKETPQHELLVFGDPELLRTMIDNVIRNAIRFSPQQQAVEVTVDADEENALVRVRDFGVGIPEEIISTLFDRFTQAKSEERLNRGSGLGLEIAQGIAELHGGGITVENCLGGGCAFTIRVPMTRDRPDAV